MYAFRKPFAAAAYDYPTLTLPWMTIGVELKTAFVVSQILGYTLSKFLGVKFCSEVTRRRRFLLLVVLILAAEGALVLFAIPGLPVSVKMLAIFLNGIPLGMIWGLVVRYLEGRKTTDLLLAGLSCSFIVASGIVKSVGQNLMAGDAIRIVGLEFPNPFGVVPEFWMPAAVGALFFPPLLLSSWLLDQVPEPTPADEAARSKRTVMDAQDRRAFAKRYLPGLVVLVAVYVMLTAYRDFRDNYQVDLLTELGVDYEQNKDAVQNSELIVAAATLLSMGAIFLIKDNLTAMRWIFIVMASSILSLAGSNLLLQFELIGGFWWITLVGLGSYLCYVPFNTVLFERLMATTRTVGTAVFAIYVADAAGYSGSVVVQIARDLFLLDRTRSEFFIAFTYATAALGFAGILSAAIYFLKVKKP